jgi:GntR family transcriptional regulator / MocR family aminotransferase
MNAIISLPIVLDDKLSSPLYEQLSQSLRDAITSGRLAHGSVLDSTRDLSRKLGVSRHTVLRSVDILQSQGFLESKNGRLTTVTTSTRADNSIDLEDGCINAQPGAEISVVLSDFAKKLTEERAETNKELIDGALSSDQLPSKHWKRLMFKHIQSEDGEVYDPVQDPLGSKRLRIELAEYLQRSRSVNCDPERIVIFPDRISALDLIGKLLINQGDGIALENPSFRHSREVFKTHTSEIYPVDVDENGLSMDQLNGLVMTPKLVYVTPSHQDPLGMPMSSDRRRELLEWAVNNQSIIVEDDNDCQFRYGSRPLPALQGMDSSEGCVIYLSSFGKILSPLMNLCFAVFPESLMPGVIGIKKIWHHNAPILDQLVLADFIKDGSLERHIRKTAVTLSRRRNALITALTRSLGRKIWIARESAATHLFVKIKTDWIDAALVDCARSKGFPLVSTRDYYSSDRPPTGQFLIPFANIDEADSQSLVESFTQSII